MKLIPPKGVSVKSVEAALKRFEGVVGAGNVHDGDSDRATYLDVYSPGDAESYGPAGAVAPKSTEEVRAIVRIAAELKTPLWPISRGKNLGYGGSAPGLQGCVMLDLGRMNRIIEVNEKYGYAILEPGVGFHDLFAHLRDNKIKLWMSAPAQTWGSVVGNALERGVGYTPYGEHASKVCGMEVVLPDGDLVRTGMGALEKSSSWTLFPYGFGPAWDQAFMQSNFGVVTKMGLWMMPEPEATMQMRVNSPNDADLAQIVDTLAPLRMCGVIEANPSVANVIRGLAQRSVRSEYYSGKGVMPEDAIEAARKKAKIGRWNFSMRLFGYESVVKANAAIVKAAFAPMKQLQIEETWWHRGDPIEQSGAAIPSLNALSVVNWRGGRGGHLTFSPISAPSGDEAMKQYKMTRARYEEYGFDYYGGFTAGSRYLNHITMIIFDRDDHEMTAKARELFRHLVKDAAANGWGEYRTHVAFADDVAAAYNFNNQAMLRLNEKVKDALDPAGIIAPGKQGIWPKGRRPNRGKGTPA